MTVTAEPRPSKDIEHVPDPRAARRLARARKVLLLLDYDGTLAPIAPTPGAARMAPAVRRQLERLAGRPRVAVAVVSGRPLIDVRHRVGLPSVHCGGDHGWELLGPGLRFRHPEASRFRRATAALAALCRRHMEGLKGAMVEEKGFGVAVHNRRLGPFGMVQFMTRFRALKAASRGMPFRWRKGQRVWEAVPAVDWDKGRAARYLWERLGRPFPVVLGDDETDEDMFRALGGRGLSVRVRPAPASRASAALKSQDEVPAFLARIDRLVGGNGHA